MATWQAKKLRATYAAARSHGPVWLGAALCVLASACSRSPEPAAKAGDKPAEVRVPVSLQKAQTKPVQRHIDVVGTLRGDEEAVISAKIPGKVVAMYKDIGDTVETSEVVAQLIQTDYLLNQREKAMAVRESLGKIGLKELPAEGYDPVDTPAVQRARLQAQNAKSRFERGRKLFEQEQPRISQQEFDDLRTAWEVAQNEVEMAILAARNTLDEARTRQAELDIASQRLADTQVKGPGLIASKDPSVPARPRKYEVVERMASVGELVRELVPLYRVVDREVIKLRAMAAERYANQIKLGQVVKVSVEAHPDEFTGTVSRINPQIDPQSRSFLIEVQIANAEHKLMPGAFARARILTREDPAVVFVPLQSVVSFAGVNKVYTVADGKAKEIVVELGDRQGDWIEVTKPLTGEESVVVNGQTKLAMGTAVDVKSAAETK